jgi:hypothetical protein
MKNPIAKPERQIAQLVTASQIKWYRRQLKT